MNVDFKNMMLACLGHLNIQWDWPRCPSSWHSRHLYPFVMLNVQCLVASSLGQSMPHSCSLKDPMCFPFLSFFSISGYMPATKKKSLHSTAGSENIWQLCCQNLFHTAITISKTNVGSSTKSSKKQIQWTLWDHVIPSAFYSFHLISFTRISRGQSHYRSRSLNNKYEYHSTSQSTARKSAANVRTPSVTSSEPLPKPENPSGATAAVVGHVHLGPSRDQLLDHGGVTVLSRPMQRCPASGAKDATRKAGLLQLPSRNKAIVMGCFSGLLGKYFWIGHKYQIRQADTFCMFYCEAWQTQEEQS